MAKGVLISLYDESAYGIRMLSACLKKAGHNRHIIFLKGYKTGMPRERVRLYEGEKPWEGVGPFGNSFVYAISRDITDREKDILIKLLRDIRPDFIGLTVNTPLKWRAILISNLIKQKFPDILLVWGGFEPTINPKESLEYCDIVARGEAEQAVVEMADALDKNRDLSDIKNLCFKKSGKFISNGLNPPWKNLDELPFQDYEPEGNYFIEDDSLKESPKFLFPSPNLYSTITARGCIFQCSYCCELYIKDLYKPHTFLRRRSPENVIAELKEVKTKFNINYIIFQDEIFSYQSEWLKRFVPLYKEKIAIPFCAFMFPSKDFRERLGLLKEAGLSSTCVAVQSGSQRICKAYNRYYNKELFLESAHTIRSMNLSFYTDVITYNPLEKREDLEDTLDFLLELPQPYDLCINKLYLLPGTKLCQELTDLKLDKTATRTFDYYSGLFWLSSYFKNSKRLVGIIKSVRLFENHPNLLRPILYLCYMLGCLYMSIYKVRKIRRSGRLNLRFIINFIKLKVQALTARV